MPRTLIKAGTVLTMDDQRGIFSPGHLLFDGAEIIAVGAPEDVPQDEVDKVIDFSDRLVMPGLVNAHAHTPMSLFRDWLKASRCLRWTALLTAYGD